MFYPEKIKNIRSTDKVLEVGPGGTPHPRSNVFLEKIYASEAEWELQRGYADKLESNKKIVYYEGGSFPFKDNEFDYVICSHVIEHVVDVEFFLSELFRVAPRGYIEYPTIYYEYLYNFNVHLNFIKFKDGYLYYLKKEDTDFGKFLPVQRLFYRSLEMGYSNIVDDLKRFMFEGFEWEHKFKAELATSIDDLVFNNIDLPKFQEHSRPSPRITFYSNFLKKIRMVLKSIS